MDMAEGLKEKIIMFWKVKSVKYFRHLRESGGFSALVSFTIFVTVNLPHPAFSEYMSIPEGWSLRITTLEESKSDFRNGTVSNPKGETCVLRGGMV